MHRCGVQRLGLVLKICMCFLVESIPLSPGFLTIQSSRLLRHWRGYVTRPDRQRRAQLFEILAANHRVAMRVVVFRSGIFQRCDSKKLLKFWDSSRERIADKENSHVKGGRISHKVILVREPSNTSSFIQQSSISFISLFTCQQRIGARF
jgi:hypothetical protein